MNIKEITDKQAKRIIFNNHYSKVMPKINKYFLGLYNNNELVGTITLGYGVRPLHTIRKLFPSLTAKDYLEIGKMCVVDSMPRNTESQFLSKMIKWIKQNHPEIKLIFTWADGMLGKAGYVYQSANFLYGGYILTDSYFSDAGEKIHPRATGKIGGRPSDKKMNKFGWLHYKGKQFRYVYFTCDRRDKKKLLKESTVNWGIDYPKDIDLLWRLKTDNGWVDSVKPNYKPDSLEYRSPIPLFTTI